MMDYAKLLGDMARAIVETPDEVSVEQREENDGVILTLKVAEADTGMVIGKHGNIARALRTVTKAAGKMTDKKITVEIK